MENYALEELKQHIMNELFELEDLLVTKGEDARYYRLYGKRESYKDILDKINEIL